MKITEFLSNDPEYHSSPHLGAQQTIGQFTQLLFMNNQFVFKNTKIFVDGL